MLLHYGVSLGCFCSSSLTPLVCFWYIYFIFTYFIYLLFIIFYFGMLACFVCESSYFNSQLMACNGYWVKPVEPINHLLYVFKDSEGAQPFNSLPMILFSPSNIKVAFIDLSWHNLWTKTKGSCTVMKLVTLQAAWLLFWSLMFANFHYLLYNNFNILYNIFNILYLKI